jgi:hypothetical protein
MNQSQNCRAAPGKKTTEPYLKGGELPGFAKPTSDYRGIIGKAPHVKRRKI